MIGALLLAWAPWLVSLVRCKKARPDVGALALQYRLIGDYFRGRLDETTRRWMHAYVVLMAVFLLLLLLFPFSSAIAQAA